MDREKEFSFARMISIILLLRNFCSLLFFYKSMALKFQGQG